MREPLTTPPAVSETCPAVSETGGPADAPARYRVLREIGRRGLSLVAEAVDTRTGQRVAIKRLLLPPSLSPDERAAMAKRLNREARAFARLSHPNIVSILADGKEDGQPFLVMEFVEGRTLRERLRDGPLSPPDAAAILEQAAAALDAVHTAGIVHRDMKPSNLMLLGDGTVKLMDFGIARQSEDTLVTQAGTLVGSPSYMAPEQIQGDTVGPACDVWALGVLLYEMLSGRPPFGGDRIGTVLHQIIHEDPPPLPHLPPAVQAVLGKALAKNPAKRFRSAGALAGAYRAALHPLADTARGPWADTPAAPSPDAPPRGEPSPAEPSLRRPLAVLAAGLLLLALLAQALRPHPPAPAPHAPAASPRPSDGPVDFRSAWQRPPGKR